MASTSMFNAPYEGAIPFVYELDDQTPKNIFIKMYELAKYDYPDWNDTQIHEYCFEGQQKDLLHDETHIERKNEKNRQDIDKSFGIMSLTIHPLNYLMWSHYANSHKGFCIGFDTDLLEETINGTLSPVKLCIKIAKIKTTK